MKPINPGSNAPQFTLKDQEGKALSLSDYKGSKVLIFFYPKADTPGCTKQACEVSASLKKLSELNCKAVGISPDAPDKQKAFDQKHQLSFPLLADADHKVAEAYGAWGEKSMYGRKYMGVIRSAFLIDEHGKCLNAWEKITPAKTVPEALKALQ